MCPPWALHFLCGAQVIVLIVHLHGCISITWKTAFIKLFKKQRQINRIYEIYAEASVCLYD